MAKVKKTKLNEVIFKSYQDAINNRMKAGHDVSRLTKRLNTLIAQHSNKFFSLTCWVGVIPFSLTQLKFN